MIVSKPSHTVGPMSGPSLEARVVQRCRTVGRIHGGRILFLILAALCEMLSFEGVPALLGVRNWERETSLVGVPLDGKRREAGDLSVLDLGVPRPVALGRPARDVSGRILSRYV